MTMTPGQRGQANSLIEVEKNRLNECKYCGAPIVFIFSERKGRWYTVNFEGLENYDQSQLVVDKTNFHECKR